ncbi:4-alpha-glucanotransferase [Shewanella electrodiphila]|uniref:4-alpha-glucanotransferase n=1 Tax=Shewanella electrodiphila TaxID=934143 RepID=A0ABT0KML5_9GAMM|nr:4-alpha-glucanotransferase [Shewanella electrodiphila]MCL1045090.1 4-alpha-glucanotransferase [Shewanella electrodiphila]
MGLEKLLYLQGVGAEFIDCFGNNIHICPEDRNGILKSMCLGYLDKDPNKQSFSDAYIEQRIYELDVKPWLIPLHHFQWSNVDEPVVEVFFPESFIGQLRVEIISEQGDVYRFQVHSHQLSIVGDYQLDSIKYFKYQYRLNLESNMPVGLGYHQISLTTESDNYTQTYTGIFMLAPRSAYCGTVEHQESELTTHLKANSASKLGSNAHVNTNGVDASKPWGISTQLYSIKSHSQWGIGDFNDLQKLIDYSAEQGADFILLNPLHALGLPDSVSPYSPDDRRRLNPLYIHIESVDEYASIAAIIQSDEFDNKKTNLFNEELLNYSAVYQVKYSIYRLLFDVFITKNSSKRSKRFKQFTQFKKQQGEALSQFVDHQLALSNNSPAAEPHHINVSYEADFICYLQFVAAEQLALCQLKAKSVGMQIGLIRDMAVGASPTGSEVQQNASYFCQQANIGAPPDPFAPQGQNWGLTPLDPINLQQQSYQHFITLIRSNMESCGGLRIDHVMGLLRLWWWPTDTHLGNGAYVYYPLDTLLAILCLESQRTQCLLIGEDLGIVPPEIVQNLSKAKIFSNELFYFTKNYHGFTPPEFYKPHSLMMLANHDVPTLSAWWNGDDIQLRQQLGLTDTEQKYNALNDRLNEKLQLLDLLKSKHFLPSHITLDDIKQPALINAWLSLTASGESMLYSVQLDDLINEVKPINIPGTWKEYPNWRRRLSQSLEQIMDSEDVKQKLHIVNRARHCKQSALAESCSLSAGSIE